MKKGFITTLFAATLFACASTTFAAAPVIRSLPDITIGDQEDNVGTDNNFFVFTNAFQFDNCVSDPDTPVANLLWSFDELGDSTQQWFTVNGKNPIHVGNAAVAAGDGTTYAPHNPPVGANELRQPANGGSNYASFRDIVFSPWANSPPFPTPVDPAKSDHALGKVVRFYVSDGTMVAHKDVIVNTIDNGWDSATETSPFKIIADDGFTTDPRKAAGSIDGWSPFGLSTATQPLYPNGLVAYDWDSDNSSLRAHCNSSLTDSYQNYRYRAAGWLTNAVEWMKYASVGSTDYVRTKYYIYATPTTTSPTMAENQIPNFRCGVSERFALTQNMEIQHHQVSDWPNYTWARELRPNTDPARPSLYRVDLAPIPVPYLEANKHFEGFMRRFDIYGLDPIDQGCIACAEAIIGHYPRSVVDGVETTLQTYAAADLVTFNPLEQQALNYDYNIPGVQEGQYPNIDTTPANVGVFSNGGITMDTSNLPPVLTTIGILQRDYNPDANTGNLAIHPRVEPNKQYKVRFHLTSTQQTNQQASIWCRVRSIKFGWSYKLELAGSFATGGDYANPGANNIIAQQTIPGVGTMNPDQKVVGENGGWYTAMMHTPMSADIRSEYPDGTPLTTSMPMISAEAGPGVNVDSRRDIRVGTTLVDSLDFTPMGTVEKGNVTCDEIVVKSAPLVRDF